MSKLSFLLVLAVSLSSAGQVARSVPASSVSERIQAQDVIFADYYSWWRSAHPVMATIFGDYSLNDRLGDYSLAGAARDHRQKDELLSRLRAIPTDGMPEQDRTSHDLLTYALAQADESYSLNPTEFAVWLRQGLRRLSVATEADTTSATRDN